MKNNLPSRVGISIIIFLYFAFSLFNYSFITEDAFIFFRAAEYLLNGHGYVFNPGEKIETCSSTTWLFLITSFGSLGFNLLTTSKILGIVFGCFSLLLIFLITQRFTNKMPWVILPSFLTSISMPFLLWNQMGLETALYTLLLLSLIFICLNKNFFFLWPLIAILLVLTRPEGIFLLLGLVPVFYFYRERRKEIFYSSIVFVLLVFITITVRFFYFHDFLPSPFYIKIYPGKSLQGLHYIHSFFKDFYMYYFFIPLLFFIWRKWNWQKNQSILFVFITVYLSWVAFGGSENKPFFRHLVPIIPIIYIYIIIGIKKALSKFSTNRQVILTSCIFLFGFTSLFLPKGHTVFNTSISNPAANNIKDFINKPWSYLSFRMDRLKDPATFNHINYEGNKQLLLGEFIRRNYFKGSTLVYDQMGQTPYKAGIEYSFIDSWGLTDRLIGHYYFHNRIKNNNILRFYERTSTYFIKTFFPDEKFIFTKKAILTYIFRQDPDVILILPLLCYSKEHLPYWIIRDVRFSKNYSLNYYINGTLIFEKNGLKKKPLNIPEGLPVIFPEDIHTVLKKNHPFLPSLFTAEN